MAGRAALGAHRPPLQEIPNTMFLLMLDGGGGGDCLGMGWDGRVCPSRHQGPTTHTPTYTHTTIQHPTHFPMSAVASSRASCPARRAASASMADCVVC